MFRFSTLQQSKIFIPSNIEQFLFDYKHSKFIECNKKLLKDSLANEKQENSYKSKLGLLYAKAVLESYRKNYWLAAGTLLGKLNLFFIII